MYNTRHISVPCFTVKGQGENMRYTYTPHGVCARNIAIELDDNNIITNVEFTGGCNGNLQGISALVKGKKPDEIIEALKGIDCNFKGTSCPDQLAKALEEINSKIH